MQLGEGSHGVHGDIRGQLLGLGFLLPVALRLNIGLSGLQVNAFMG